MRTSVKVAVVLGVMIVAACTMYALHFAMQTNNRLVRLEDYVNGRTSVRNQQYDQQEREIRDLQQRICILDPASCDG